MGTLALACKLAGLPDLLILFLGGLAVFLHSRRTEFRQHAWFLGSAPSAEIFAVFFKIGAVLFGSGYTLLIYLKDDLVHRLG
ncbi:hypothetical protein [Oligoflexus tunisiensis]|uniref:hypothetical protein n=1 Tax=Oligoflexus tunisiensis TaxID=708132 RepID=UPI001FE20ECD|nr:hypothetical protein [Oligoflexus tunisiensis]